MPFEENILEVNDSALDRLGAKKDVFEENKRFLADLDTKAKQSKIDVATCVYAGKLFNTYLLYEKGDTAYIIDQHAAHERLIFARLKEQMNSEIILSKFLLFLWIYRISIWRLFSTIFWAT